MNGVSLNISERNTPPLFGVGLIDEISSELLVALAARQPAAIRGRVNRTKEGRIGRFGSKAQVATLHEFVRGACANELGLEVPGHSQGVSPLAKGGMANGLDLTEPECDDLVAYVRALPAPRTIDLSGPLGTQDMRTGRRLFAQVNCASCHVPDVGDAVGIYSDLLLHTMGQSLSDASSTYGVNRPNSSPDEPSPREWRTAPLWGYRDSGPYMHDGRAQTLEEAVALHEGQAKASARQFFRLTAKERSQVEAFLKSLVAPAPPAQDRMHERATRPGGVIPNSGLRPKPWCAGSGKKRRHATSRHSAISSKSVVPRKQPGERVLRFRWRVHSKRWARSPARSRSTRRSLAKLPVRKKAVWLNRESASSARPTGERTGGGAGRKATKTEIQRSHVAESLP